MTFKWQTRNEFLKKIQTTLHLLEKCNEDL